MSRMKNYLHEELDRRCLSPDQLKELAYELEIEEKDKYYQEHPEQTEQE